MATLEDAQASKPLSLDQSLQYAMWWLDLDSGAGCLGSGETAPGA
jgi:hypothetical protein